MPCVVLVETFWCVCWCSEGQLSLSHRFLRTWCRGDANNSLLLKYKIANCRLLVKLNYGMALRSPSELIILSTSFDYVTLYIQINKSHSIALLNGYFRLAAAPQVTTSRWWCCIATTIGHMRFSYSRHLTPHVLFIHPRSSPPPPPPHLQRFDTIAQTNNTNFFAF